MGLACEPSVRLCQRRSANPVLWRLAPGRPERRRDAAYPRPVPPDAPAVKPSRTGSETWPLKAAPVGIGPRLWFQTHAACRPPWATVLSEPRAGDDSGKNDESAKRFHWLPPHSSPEEAPCHENVPLFKRTCSEQGRSGPRFIGVDPATREVCSRIARPRASVMRRPLLIQLRHPQGLDKKAATA